MKRFLLLLCALCTSSFLFAATETVNGITWSYSVSNGEAEIGPGSWDSPAIPSSTSGAITIPSTLGGYPVTSIGECAFYCCYDLTSVTIPEGVTSIGSHAFQECRSLTSVALPEGLTSIEYWAFDLCTNLTSITIPSSVTSLDGSVFEGCTDLKIFVAKDNPNYASQDGALFNKEMTSLIRAPGEISAYTIPSSVTYIKPFAFCYRWGLTSVTIPDGVTSIGMDAFRACFDLTSITIPSSVTSIGSLAFAYCDSLTSIDFLGAPPSSYWYSDLTAIGTYLPEYASEWEAVLDADDKWNGLTMQMVEVETTSEITFDDLISGEDSALVRTWLMDIFSKEGVAGKVVLGNDTTTDDLNDAHLLGVMPNWTADNGTIIVSAKKTTFEITSITVTNNEETNVVTLITTVTVGTGTGGTDNTPESITLGGDLIVRYKTSLTSDWEEKKIWVNVNNTFSSLEDKPGIYPIETKIELPKAYKFYRVIVR